MYTSSCRTLSAPYALLLNCMTSCLKRWGSVICQKKHMVGFTFPDVKLLCNRGRNCLLLALEKAGKKLCHTNYANSVSYCEIPHREKRIKQGREKRKAAIVLIEIKRSGSNYVYHLRHGLCKKNLYLHPSYPLSYISPLSLCPTVSQWAGWLGLKWAV